jgi:hypothetical protein
MNQIQNSKTRRFKLPLFKFPLTIGGFIEFILHFRIEARYHPPAQPHDGSQQNPGGTVGIEMPRPVKKAA